MGATAWSKFYWSDWLSDSGLRRSSLAARGLWMDMLCIAAQADPIGYLAVKKHPLSVDDIARMVGGSEPVVATLIEELERNGVLSRDRNGTIYSRRITRDVKKSRDAQKNGRKGGNPRLRKTTENQPPDNLPLKDEVKPQKPEASYQKEDNPQQQSIPPREAAAAIDVDRFEDIDRKLRSVPGIEKHPVFTSPVIAPIWKLVQQGLSFETTILPKVRALAQRTKPIRSWAFFADIIAEEHRELEAKMADVRPTGRNPQRTKQDGLVWSSASIWAGSDDPAEKAA